MEWTVCKGLWNASHSYQRNGFTRALEDKGCLPFTNCIIKTIAEPYIKRRAVRHLEKGRIVILEPEPETLILPLIQQLFCVV
jgi:hypothetical protein